MAKSIFNRLFFTVCSIIILFIYPIFSFSADYPTKPINLLIPYGVGGPVDVSGKCLAEIAREILGQPVVAVNKAGGGGVIAPSITAKEKPDGYTLSVVSNTAFTYIPQMRDVPYDPLKDFEFIIGHMQNPGGIMCRGDSPWKSMKDLIIYSKQNPGKVSYGCVGVGGAGHLATELILVKEDIKWRTVPFDGNPKIISALLGRHIDLYCSGLQGFRSLMKAGELRALAVEGVLKEKFPGVRTFEELGYELPMGVSLGIVAPKGTSAPIIKKLHDTFKKAMEDPRYVALCENLDSSKEYFSGVEFFQIVKDQYELGGKVLDKLGLKKK